jgi:hypothetical protein
MTTKLFTGWKSLIKWPNDQQTIFMSVDVLIDIIHEQFLVKSNLIFFFCLFYKAGWLIWGQTNAVET